MFFQNILDLLRGQSVKPATKGTELNQCQIGVFSHELRRMVQAGMIAPLVDHLQALCLDRQMIDGIFGQDGQFIGLNHLGNTVVDFRVHMIGTAHEHNRLLSGALNMLQNLFAIITHIFAVTGNFHISGFHCPGDFLPADVFPLAEFLVKAGR